MRRICAAAIAAACCALAVMLPAAAGAATVAPTTGVENLETSGDCTLREAVHYLNTDGASAFDDACTHTGTLGTDDTIQLAAGTDYTIEFDTGNEDANLNGDLDILESLTIAGDPDDPPAIRNTVLDRVLDVVATDADLTLESLTVEDGQIQLAGTRGANIRFAGGADRTLTLDDVTVRDGVAGTPVSLTDIRGGGIAAEGGGHVLIRNGSLITQNRTGNLTGNFYYGGGIYIGGAGTDLTVTGSEISANETSVAAGETPTGGAGGGIYSDATGASAIVLDGATIDGNRAGGGSSGAADGYGGGIALGSGGGNTNSSLQITGGSVSGNRAAGGLSTGQGRGGGIFVDGAATGFSLDGVTVTGNEAGGLGGTGGGIGGGIYTDRALTVTGGSVSQNKAGAAPSAGGAGGGISVNGLLTDSDLTLTGTTISQNVVSDLSGDGGNGGGVSMTSAGTLTVTGSAISDNDVLGSAASGGGIYRETGTSTAGDSIATSTIAGNSAKGGGGIYLQEDSPLSIESSTINSNTATGGFVDGGGGGIYTGSDLNVFNSTLDGNQANGTGSSGGGIRSDNLRAAPQVDLDHVTMTGQVASSEGGHLYLEGAAGDATIRASILGLGTASGAPTTSACHQQVAGLINSGGFNVEVATDQCGFDAGGDLASVPNGDADLGALGNNGGPTATVALGPDSVAIDTVTSGCTPPTADQRGISRPQGPRCDSGAFELEYRTLTASVAGTGSGTVTAAGISCPGDCAQDFPIGTEVTLTATPTGGTFTSWSGGGCSGTGPCLVTMAADTAVTANFTATPAPPNPPADPVPPRAKKCKKGFKRVKGKGKCKKKRKKRKKK